MKSLKWRWMARFVAFADMFVTIMKLILVLLITVTAGIVTSAATSRGEIPDNETIHRIWTVWSITGIFAISSAFHFWAVIQLMSATAERKDPANSLKECGYWRTVSIIILIVHSIFNILQEKFIVLAADIGSRVIFLFIVYIFMWELKKLVDLPESKSSSQDTDLGSNNDVT